MSTQDSILVVDDEDGIRSALKEILFLAGYAVVTANCGEEAIEILKSNASAFSLVLLDLRLPDMNGMEFVKKITKDLLISVPVIFVSGAMNLEEAKLPPEVSGFISKPFDIEVLLSLVDKTLRKAQDLLPTDRNISAVS